MAYALTEEPIVLDLCQKRGFFASCRVPYARRMPASTFAIAGCEASKPCPAIRCAAVIAATRRLRVATTPAFEGSIIRVVGGSIIRVVEGSIIRVVGCAETSSRRWTGLWHPAGREDRASDKSSTIGSSVRAQAVNYFPKT